MHKCIRNGFYDSMIMDTYGMIFTHIFHNTIESIYGSILPIPRNIRLGPNLPGFITPNVLKAQKTGAILLELQPTFPIYFEWFYWDVVIDGSSSNPISVTAKNGYKWFGINIRNSGLSMKYWDWQVL